MQSGNFSYFVLLKICDMILQLWYWVLCISESVLLVEKTVCIFAPNPWKSLILRTPKTPRVWTTRRVEKIPQFLGSWKNTVYLLCKHFCPKIFDQNFWGVAITKSSSLTSRCLPLPSQGPFSERDFGALWMHIFVWRKFSAQRMWWRGRWETGKWIQSPSLILQLLLFSEFYRNLSKKHILRIKIGARK